MELTLDHALQKGAETHKAGQIQEADKFCIVISIAIKLKNSNLPSITRNNLI